MQQIAPTKEQINDHLDQLKEAKHAYDLAEAHWNIVIAQRFPQPEVKEAFRRRKIASEHYISICEWFLLNTPHGFLYDPITGTFKLR